jgi:uncharacterized membrane protein (GlpM family)
MYIIMITETLVIYFIIVDGLLFTITSFIIILLPGGLLKRNTDWAHKSKESLFSISSKKGYIFFLLACFLFTKMYSKSKAQVGNLFTTLQNTSLQLKTRLNVNTFERYNYY